MLLPRVVTHKPPFKPHVAELVNAPISQLAPYSGIILTVTLVIYFLIRFYIFEAFLMQKIYGETYKKLNDVNRRGFVNHHIAGMAKIIMLVTAAYPFISVAFGKGHMHTKFAGSGVVTLGDMLVVVSQLFIAMYIFELFYRAKLSPVAVMHHIGACVIAQSAVAMSLNWEHERDATIEFVLCFVWGAFDIIAEFWPHVAIILYRVRNTDHAFLVKVMRSACISTFCGTIIETIVVMWLFGSLWDRWTLPFKIVTPMLHVIFSAAQLWGSRNFRSMWLSQQRKLREQQAQQKTETGSMEPVVVGVPVESKV